MTLIFCDSASAVCYTGKKTCELQLCEQSKPVASEACALTPQEEIFAIPRPLDCTCNPLTPPRIERKNKAKTSARKTMLSKLQTSLYEPAAVHVLYSCVKTWDMIHLQSRFGRPQAQTLTTCQRTAASVKSAGKFAPSKQTVGFSRGRRITGQCAAARQG